MRTKRTNTALITPQTKQQWKLHQQIARFLTDLDRLPDTAEVRHNPPRSAPPEFLPMVF